MREFTGCIQRRRTGCSVFLLLSLAFGPLERFEEPAQRSTPLSRDSWSARPVQPGVWLGKNRGSHAIPMILSLMRAFESVAGTNLLGRALAGHNTSSNRRHDYSHIETGNIPIRRAPIHTRNTSTITRRVVATGGNTRPCLPLHGHEHRGLAEFLAGASSPAQMRRRPLPAPPWHEQRDRSAALLSVGLVNLLVQSPVIVKIS